MKIFSTKLFVWRMSVSIFAVLATVFPFCMATAQYPEKLDAGTGPVASYIIICIMLYLIEAVLGLLFVGLLKLVKWMHHTKAVRRWLSWICAEERADKFVERI